MILRPYQLRARALARQAYAEGKRAIVYVAPTGSGKTCVLSDTISSHVAKVPSARVNFYAHRRELLTQTANTLRAFGLECGIFGEGAAAPIQIVSTQGAIARGEVDACTMGVFDEAHHYAADEWGEVLDAHKAHGAIIVGATATPERGDGRGLDKFDHIVLVAQVKELVAQGHLVPCDLVRPARRVPKGKIAMHPLKAHRAFAHGRRNVIFAPNIKSAAEWLADFKAGGIPAGMVTGTMGADERDAALKDFRDGKLRVLINVFVLTEGFDDPGIGVVTVARSCGSAGMWIQMCGRGARPAERKDKYTVLDLRGVSYELGRPDDDREYSLEGLGISRGTGDGGGERLCKSCKRPIFADVCENCGKDNGQSVPGDAGIELARWKEEIRKDDDGKRVERLRRWLHECRVKGYQRGYAFGKYRGTYGAFPSAPILAAATRKVG